MGTPPHEELPATLPGEPTDVPDPGLDTLLPAPPLPGSLNFPSVHTTVPGYEILQELGRGGMGVVYKAKQAALNRVVALKMILAGAHAGSVSRARFKAEAEAIARLSHPNIVQIFEVGDQQGQPYFSLEFCAGGTLASALAGKPLPPGDAARLLVPLARAIHHAHAAGILHRDLKPGNVLLASGGREPPVGERGAGGSRPPLAKVVPKITDFGLAKLLDGDSRTCEGDVLGTPNYMAPEQAQGQVHLLGPHTDVYALGAILYECLTGRPPFGAATAMETLAEVNSREPVPVRTLQPKVPRDLETICHKCLQKDRARRYASAAELADDLERFLEGRPILARPVGSLEHAWRWVRRRPAQAALVLVLLIAVATGVVGWAWFTAELGRQRDEADRLRLLAEERQREAEANGELAQRNFELAEARFVKALGVVNRYFTEVSENTLLNEPGMEALRRKLLRDARDFYAGFVRERRDDPRLAAELARSVYRVAVIDGELGDFDAAVAQLEDSRQRFDGLLTASPGDQGLMTERARLLNDLGRIERLRDRFAPAVAAYQEALGAWEALVREDPGSRAAKEGLGRCLLGLGNVSLAQGRRDDAQRHYREALRLRQGLVEADGRNDGYLRDLAVTWQNLALVQAQLGQEAAGASYGQALAIFRRLVEAYPTRGRYRADLAMANYNEGVRLMQEGHRLKKSKAEGYARPLGQSCERYEESARGFEFLAFTHPGVPLYPSRAGYALWNLGLCQELLDKAGAAEETFKKAHKIRQGLADAHPTVPEYQIALAQYYHHAGDRLRDRGETTQAQKSYEQARGILEQAERKSPGSPACRALLAEVLVELGTIARKAGRLDEADRLYGQALEQAQALRRQKQLAVKAAELERLARQGKDETAKARKNEPRTK